MGDGRPANDTMYQGLVEQAPDAVIFADPEGTIRVWNRAAERIFGFAAAEAIGQNLDIIIPEKFRDAHWKGFERALGDGVTKYVGQALATKALNSAGDSMYVELSFAIVLGDDGNPTGALAHARDITERFNTEREQRKKMGELEKTVRDLRDGVPAEGGA